MSKGRTDELLNILLELQNAAVLYDAEKDGPRPEYLTKVLKQCSQMHRDEDTQKRSASLTFSDGRDIFAMHLMHQSSRKHFLGYEGWCRDFWDFLIVKRLPEKERLRTLARMPYLCLSEKDPSWGFGDFDRSIYMLGINILSEQYLGD